MHGARTTRTAARIELVAQRRQQPLRAHHLAGQAVADPDGERRRRRLALLDHVEMRVEGRDLVDRRPAAAASPRRARRDARPRDGRSGPGSGADARSADRAGAAGRRAARAPRSSACSSTWRPLGWRPPRRLPAPGWRCLRISPAVSTIPRPRAVIVSVARQRPFAGLDLARAPYNRSGGTRRQTPAPWPSCRTLVVPLAPKSAPPQSVV